MLKTQMISIIIPAYDEEAVVAQCLQQFSPSEELEVIQGFIVAKAFKRPLADLASVMFICPTLSELVKKTAALALVEKGDNP